MKNELNLPHVAAYRKGKFWNASDGGTDPLGLVFTDKEKQTIETTLGRKLNFCPTYKTEYPHFLTYGQDAENIANQAGLKLESDETLDFT